MLVTEVYGFDEFKKDCRYYYVVKGIARKDRRLKREFELCDGRSGCLKKCCLENCLVVVEAEVKGL